MAKKDLTTLQKLLKSLGEAGFSMPAYKKGIEKKTKEIKKAKGISKIPPYISKTIRQLSPVAAVQTMPASIKQMYDKEITDIAKTKSPIEKVSKSIGLVHPAQSPLAKEFLAKPMLRAVKRPIGIAAPSVYPTVEKFKKDPVMELMDEMAGIGIVAGLSKMAPKGTTEIQQELPGFETEMTKADIKTKLAEEVGAIGKKPQTPKDLKNNIVMDSRDYMTKYSPTEQLHLPLEGVSFPKLKQRTPKAMKEFLQGTPVKPTDYLEPGVGAVIRPSRKVFAKLGSDVYHAVYEPFTTAERGRYSWVRKRLEEQKAIWSTATKAESDRVGIAGNQRYNLANGLDINSGISNKVLKKYGISKGNPIKLTQREEAFYAAERQWLDNYQAQFSDRIAKRPEYWPGIKDFDEIDRSLKTMYRGESLPNDIVSFATKLRKDQTALPRDINAVSVMKKYINAEANDLYYGRLMKPTKDIVNMLKESGKGSAANYVQNYAERMVGFPGKMDRDLMNWSMKMDSFLGKKPDPQRALRASQTMLDMQYLSGLGGKPSTAIRNLAQLINTASEIGYKWSSEGVIRFLKHPKSSVTKARKAGLIEQVIPDVSPKSGLVSGRMDRLKNDMLWLFEKTEQTNRAITYEAAASKFETMWKKYGSQGNIEMFKKKAGFGGLDKPIVESISKYIDAGQLGKAKQRYARELTGNTQYLYQKGEAPLITRTQAGRQAWIFQTWWENYAEMFANWGKHKQWQNFARHVGATAAAVKAAESLGFDVRTWVGAAPFPDPYAGKFPVVTPGVQTGIDVLDILTEAGKSPMYPEEKGKGLKQALKKFGSDLPIYAPGGLLAKQLYDVSTGKRKPMDLFVSTPKPRSVTQIRQDLADINSQYDRGLISSEDKEKRYNKLLKELLERQRLNKEAK